MLRTVVSSSSFAAAFAVASLALPSGEVRAACSSDAQCTGGPARVMLILDASSDQLNDGNAAAAEGAGNWDLFRSVIGLGPDTLFNAAVEPGGPVASQVVHFGLIVYGSDAPAPGEQKRVLDYGPCTQPNLEWALDPATSCADPGCTDPYAGPEITWTFVDGSAVDPPGFAQETVSHMPRCDGPGTRCTGSDRFVDLGVTAASTNRVAYVGSTPFVHDDSTLYANILLVSGEASSDDAAMQSALEAAFDSGVTTYVVGFGAGADTPGGAFDADLQALADWGSGGTLDPWTAGNQGQLIDALREVVSTMDLPCCASIDCSDVGGADSGGGADAGDWGGVDGGGDAGADGTAGGTMDGGMDGSMSDTGGTDAGAADGELDDDGGCTCRSTSDDPPAWLLLLLLVLRRARAGKGARVYPRRLGPTTNLVP